MFQILKALLGQADNTSYVVKGAITHCCLLSIYHSLLLLLLLLLQQVLDFFQGRLLVLLNYVLAHKVVSEHGALLVPLVAIVKLDLLELIYFLQFLIDRLRFGLRARLALAGFQPLLAQFGQVLDFLALGLRLSQHALLVHSPVQLALGCFLP